MIVNRFDYRETEHGGYGVGYQLLNTQSFDATEVAAVLELLTLRRRFFGDGVIALDLGANVGVHTIEWAKHMFGWGNVVSVEAQQRIYMPLRAISPLIIALTQQLFGQRLAAKAAKFKFLSRITLPLELW